MVNKKRKSEIKEALANLNKTDVYSLLLFTLYKLKDVPQYASLSELSYILDGDSLSKLISYYGGMTIKIPTLHEMKLLNQALLLYQYVNLEDGNLEETLASICNEEITQEELIPMYTKIVEVTANYEFRRD